MVRPVPDEYVAGRPALDAVVVGKGAIIAFKIISRAAPAVEHAHENAVAAMGAIVFEETVVIRPALDEHAGRVPGMNLAGRDADPMAQYVFSDGIATGRPQLQARV